MTTLSFRHAAVLAASAFALSSVVTAAPQAQAHSDRLGFPNCTSLNRVYPHGVGRIHAHDHVSSGTPVTNFRHSNRLYRINKSHDGDGDHISCEKH